MQVASRLSQSPLYSRETVANESAAISPVQIATTQPSSLLANRIQVNAVHSDALASAMADACQEVERRDRAFRVTPELAGRRRGITRSNAEAPSAVSRHQTVWRATRLRPPHGPAV